MKKTIGFNKTTGNRVILVKGDPRNDRYNDNKDRVPPEDQLFISENDLKEDHARILTITKHPLEQNIIFFSYNQNKFVKIPQPDMRHLHLNLIGNQICKDSEEARLYEIEQKKIENQRKNYYAKNLIDEYVDSEGQLRFRILKNKFNFSDRLVQTYNLPQKEVSTLTDPPKKKNFSDNVTQYAIYNAYIENSQNMEEILNQKKNIQQKIQFERIQSARRKRAPKPSQIVEQKLNEQLRFLKSANILERMICQNSFSDIIDDFKYWEDMSDMYKEEGSLLPLWKFSNKLTKKMGITSICWNTKYKDLFAVSTGSYDFLKKAYGMILLYSLKIPNYYELKIETSTGCVSLDFNPNFSYLLACGFYDGSVCVYDLRYRNKPNFCIKSEHFGHKEPVWQVTWTNNDMEDNPNFNSISTDGQIFNWSLDKNNLTCTEIALLKNFVTENEKLKYDFETPGAGTCFDFNPAQEDLFLVGTEEGKVLEYSSLYKNELLTCYNAHTMAIYSIKWNQYCREIFITGSADWTVKIWDHKYKNPILVYELNAPVSDVAWAPYSSTVFAALTLDGFIHIYDIGVNVNKAILVQNLLYKKKRKLTRISFNPDDPIILVGDDKGTVMSFKLSPNLRSIQKDSKMNKISILNKLTFEIAKLKDTLIREIDVNEERVETTRRFLNLDSKSKFKQLKNKVDSDEEEKKPVPLVNNSSKKQSISTTKKITFKI